MTQTRKNSLIEAMTNTGVAFGVSLGAAWLIYPLYYPGSSFVDALELTLFFTVLSIARGYVIRRWFNRKEFLSDPNVCPHGDVYDHCPLCCDLWDQ